MTKAVSKPPNKPKEKTERERITEFLENSDCIVYGRSICKTEEAMTISCIAALLTVFYGLMHRQTVGNFILGIIVMICAQCALISVFFGVKSWFQRARIALIISIALNALQIGTIFFYSMRIRHYNKMFTAMMILSSFFMLCCIKCIDTIIIPAIGMINKGMNTNDIMTQLYPSSAKKSKIE